MSDEELFCKLFPEYVVNGKPLSPYFDLFESGYEQSEKQIEELEKENAELKGEADSVLDNWCKGNDPCPHLKKRDEQLTNAKEIIKKLYAVYYDPCVTESDLKYRDELFAEIKQFLSEVEK